MSTLEKKKKKSPRTHTHRKGAINRLKNIYFNTPIDK